MTAREIVAALGGRWHGSYGTARCPAHDDRSPSLSVTERDGKLLTNCHAGCEPSVVWEALRGRDIIPARDRGAAALGQAPRLARSCRPMTATPRSAITRPSPATSSFPDTRHRALGIWRATSGATETLVAEYLAHRGITIPIPPTIRYHPALRHPDEDSLLPCMIAAVADVNRHIIGISRTYLDSSGSGKADVPRPRLSLGTIRAGAVRLAPATDRVWLAEGIEDALSLIQMTGESAWAVLGTAGFGNVELPESITRIVLAPDNDSAGQATIAEAARRLAGEGREVRIARPKAKDWNEALEHFEERAGIMEFDAMTERATATARAGAEIAE